MRTQITLPPGVEDRSVKPAPVEIEVDLPPGSPAEVPDHVQTCLKFVQVGVWEARRRCLTGQTNDLNAILAHLDEDLELLKRALHTPRRRKRQPAKV